MGEIIFCHNGIIDKYLGDGFLAIFGAPVSHPHDADNAVQAAIEMKNALAAFNADFGGDMDTRLDIGISVHTGDAVVGNMGFEKKMDYTVIGETVNIVFEIQDIVRSMPHTILISEETLNELSAVHPSVRLVKDITATKSSESLKAYEILPSGESLQ